MSKKIKSLIIAGLLVFGMSGNVFADSDTGYVMVDYTQTQIDPNVAEYNENGISVDVVCIGGFGKFDENGEFHDEYWPNNSYSVTIKWDANEVTPYGSEVMYMVDGVEESIPLNINTTEGQATAQFTLPDGASIKAVDLAYNVSNNEQQGQPTVSFNDAEQKVINKYRESMTAVGVLNNGERQIDTSFMIEKQAWEDFIADVNVADNYVTIEAGEEKGEYHVYTNVSGEKKLIEVIFIDFFESDSKGWVPEITPGTGQAIAVGGIVILAVASVGLLVNNKKKKDEEK